MKKFSGILAILPIILIGLTASYLLRVLGFDFDSIWSVMWFFIWSGLIGFPMELFAFAVPSVLLYFDMMSLFYARLAFWILDTSTSIIAMVVVDSYMDSITVSATAIVLCASITSLLCVDQITTDIFDDL